MICNSGYKDVLYKEVTGKIEQLISIRCKQLLEVYTDGRQGVLEHVNAFWSSLYRMVLTVTGILNHLSQLHSSYTCSLRCDE